MVRVEQDSGVDIVHGWFTEGGNSILSVLFASLQERSYNVGS